MVGGGGGGAGGTTQTHDPGLNGGNGTASSIIKASPLTNILIAGGGFGAANAGVGSGGCPLQDGAAAKSNSGSGGGGGAGVMANVRSGGAGAYVDAVITTLSPPYNVTVGDGGFAGQAGFPVAATNNGEGSANGGAGGSGLVEITEYYQ